MPASYRGAPDLAALVANAAIDRFNLMRRLQDPRRNLAHECGYPELEPTAEEYQALYERSEIATRVVQSLPRECWALPPCVYEDEDADTITPFEQAWDGLGRQLRGQFGWHKEEAGSGIWPVLRRADEESRIGRYGGILFGIDDGLPLDTPAAFKPGPTATRKLLYLRTFSEVNATVETWDNEEQSPRFGQPLTYALKVADPASVALPGGMSSRTLRVHWTRFLHVPADDEVSAMRPVLRRLLDLEKLYAGSAEMYWQGALPGWQFKADPRLDPAQVDLDPADLRNAWEEYSNSVSQRIFGMIGGELSSLAPQVVDPRPQINAQLQAIAVGVQMPQRKLMGSERGELSSGQDEDDHAVIIRGRKQGHCTTRLVCGFTDRSIALSLLPVPASGEYYCWWPEEDRTSEAEKAEILLKKTQALGQYVATGAEALMPPMDYLTRMLGFSEEEAAAILENAEALAEERAEEEAERMEAEAAAAAQVAAAGAPRGNGRAAAAAGGR